MNTRIFAILMLILALVIGVAGVTAARFSATARISGNSVSTGEWNNIAPVPD